MALEELAVLRRASVTLDPLTVWVTEAAPELNTGRRPEGDPMPSRREHRPG